MPAIVRVDVRSVSKKLHRDVVLEVRDSAIDTRHRKGLLGKILALGLGPVLVSDRCGAMRGRRMSFACGGFDRCVIVLAFVAEEAGASEELAASFGAVDMAAILTSSSGRAYSKYRADRSNV